MKYKTISAGFVLCIPLLRGNTIPPQTENGKKCQTLTILIDKICWGFRRFVVKNKPPQSWHLYTFIRDTIPSSSITTQKLPSCKTNCMDYRLCFLSFQNQTLGVCSFLFISPFRHFSKHAHGSASASHLLRTKNDALHLSLHLSQLLSLLVHCTPLSMLPQCSLVPPDS